MPTPTATILAQLKAYKPAPIVYEYSWGSYRFGRPTVGTNNQRLFAPGRKAHTTATDAAELANVVRRAVDGDRLLIFDEEAVGPVGDPARRNFTDDEWHDVLGRVRAMAGGPHARIAIWNHPGNEFFNTIQRGKGHPAYDAWRKWLADYAKHPLAQRADVILPGMGWEKHCPDLARWREKKNQTWPIFEDLAAQTRQELIPCLHACPATDGGPFPTYAEMRHMLDAFGGQPVAVWIPAVDEQFTPALRAIRDHERGK
ncbi:MAG TPA: hypothetical protein VEA69_16690 [Tepidisphaeraceae bacterium]|nr:hypothetical protein [Tepidisphaeraceae bacterium]